MNIYTYITSTAHNYIYKQYALITRPYIPFKNPSVIKISEIKNQKRSFEATLFISVRRRRRGGGVCFLTDPRATLVRPFFSYIHICYIYIHIIYAS